ncbi:YlbL family protein [Microlunatus ginsengisoli]|uniref:endopeptidase La n=1 Tax=Microlunatus ginsengisoli TaxID=363863 RepID=A0ABP6ZVW2_9ACTN
MTRQTWTALVAALSFVALAALLAVIGVPYVTWSPSGVHDVFGTVDTKGNSAGEPMIQVSGIATYPTTGQLDLTTVAVTSADARLSLPEALAAYWLPHRDVLPRDSVYPPGTTEDQAVEREADQMSDSQDNAVVAALREAGQPVTEMPVITAVTVGAPAHGKLQPGDLIVSVGGTKIAQVADVGAAIRKYEVGEQVPFVVLRQGERTEVEVSTASSSAQAGVPVVGITVGTGYSYEPTISFDLGEQLGGPSAGLVFALAIYDKITPGGLLDGRHVAGTGTIDANGVAGPIGGIQQKIAGAQRAGATVFLVPAANCDDLAGVQTDLSLVKVRTLHEAVAALQKIDQDGPDAAGLPRC